jgi:putative oxygen-independent coproporphyrinogen III oxidase
MLLARPYSGKAAHSFGVPTSAYIHIPFCRRRCYYCDFPVSVVGDRPLSGGKRRTGEEEQGTQGDRINGSNSGTIAYYVEVLCQEIRLAPSLGKSLQTVFFGGGTPSLLSVEQLNYILNVLDQQFGIASDAEISMEIDPGTFDSAQIQGYRAAGVNRVSLGVQAFQPELLAACGRSHTVPEVYAAIKHIHQAGFQNFSLDLISGLPHQTLDHWQESLEKAIALSPTHLSCYDLTVESVTPFSRQFKPGMNPLPSDEATAEMYRTAQRGLTAAGYDHYEISNYAKPGFQCRHNRVYWQNQPFYGFGMGATSYLGGDRVSRPRKTREYYEWVNERIKDKGLGIKAEHGDPSLTFCPSDFLLDTLMVGLRLAEGLSLEALAEQFGQETLQQIWVCLQPYHQQGWVEISSKQASEQLNSSHLPKQGRLRLTDPEGFLFSNVILISLFEKFE